MKYLLICLLLLGTSYTQSIALPDSIREIPPLPQIEIQVFWDREIDDVCCAPGYIPLLRIDGRIRRKYDTYNELILMNRSDVWMADPSARTGRD